MTGIIALASLYGYLAADNSRFGRVTGGGLAFATQGPPSGKVKASSDSKSGIEGTILISPVCPVERNPPLPECAPKPYQATVIVKSADGTRQVARFSSDSDGRFSVALDPGKYLLVPSNGEPYPRAPSQVVRVEPHKFAQVSINYDSGMR